MWMMVDPGRYVPVIGIIILALDGVGADAVFLDQRRRRIILGAQRVGGAKDDIGTTSLECACQVGGLGGYVQTCGNAYPRQRLLFFKTLAYGGQHLHSLVDELDLQLAFFSKTHIFDVVGYNFGHSLLLPVLG